jgi:TonB family protein
MKTLISITTAFALSTLAIHSNAKEAQVNNYIDLTKGDSAQALSDYWKLVQHSQPQFPATARRKGLSGCVDVQVRIDNNGRATGFKIAMSYPKGVFDEKAVLALDKWRWSPTSDNKERTPVLTTVPLNFKLVGSRNAAKAKEHCKF